MLPLLRHLVCFHSWYVSFFLFWLHEKIYVDVYLKIFGCTLKCFIQFACTNLDGSQKEGDNFLNLLQKEGGTQRGWAVPSEKGVFQPWRKLAIVVITGRARCYVFMITSMPLLSVPSKNIRKPEVLWGFLMYLVGRDVCLVVYRNFFGILKLWWKFQNQCVRAFLESWSLTSMSVWPVSVHWGINPPSTQKRHPFFCAKPRPLEWANCPSLPLFRQSRLYTVFSWIHPPLKIRVFSEPSKRFSFLKSYSVFQN